jgi:hypothetical protein
VEETIPQNKNRNNLSKCSSETNRAAKNFKNSVRKDKLLMYGNPFC